MTRSKGQPRAATVRRALCVWVLPAALVALAACGDGDSPPPDPQGSFGDSAVAGLNYTSAAGSGVTDASGRYSYREGQSISFSIGNLALGSATAAATLTPLAITAGAAAASDPAVNNKLVLLQTLDADGNLNNGIQITEAIRNIVSAQAAAIQFNQPTAAFRTSLAPLMTALNAAGVFTDTDPRDRTVRPAVAALEHYTRATSARNTVTLDSGAVRGYGATATTWQYLGIPYARPPLGDLRWRAPQAPLPWSGVRDAIAWGDQAPQNPSYQAFGEGGMSEDCLYLNVTAPRNANNLPVMVWFHGGGFVILTGNTKAFNNASSLPTRDVVLVTVTHRLGPFGYLAHPALSAESGYGGSGNYGQMDLIAALQWVQRNIARFGGNPDNVTIFGESGGGGKVISLMNSPIATGLFHKAIVQSGMAEMSNTILNVPTLAQAEAVGSGLFARLATPTLAEARAKTWVEIIDAELAHYPRGDYRDAYGPNIDSRYATKTMRQSIEDGLPSDVPLLAGNNSGDMPGLITGMIEQMPWRSSHNQAPQYVYKFSQVPAGWAARGVLSYHGGELVYSFNYPQSLVSHHLLGLVIDPATGTSLAIGDLNGNGVTGSAGDAADVMASAGYGTDDAAVAQMVMTMWTNFARTGNPSTATFAWPAYTTANDTFVEITTTPTVRTGLATGW